MNLFNVITLFPNLINEWKNTGIIFQAIKNLNHHVKIVNHSKEIKRFDIIILPGVGTFNKAINLLNFKKMTSEIKKFSKKK